jgi:hypothetical protein
MTLIDKVFSWQSFIVKLRMLATTACSQRGRLAAVPVFYICQPSNSSRLKTQSTKYIKLLTYVRSAGAAADKRTKN